MKTGSMRAMNREKGSARTMEPNFKADEFSRLTPSERVNWCRQMAAEAERLAEAASPRVRTAYVELARQWSSLADEIERDLSRKV
ncbi:MAG: hypothetical protein ACREMY_02245 [bacterium]